MNPSLPVKSASGVSMLCETNIGPLENARKQVWSKLIDFPTWPDAIPNLQSLAVSVDLNPGRGTQIEFDWKTSRQQAVISHWHPNQQLDIVIFDKRRQIGLRFDLIDGKTNGCIQLLVTCEVARYERLLGPADHLIRRYIKNSLRSCFQSLLTGIRIQIQSNCCP